MNNGSVYVLMGNGSILDRYTLDNAVWSLSTSDLFHDQDEEIVAGSGNNVHEFDRNLNLLWTYPLQGPVRKIQISDIDKSGNDEIIAEFIDSDINGIAVIEREGEEIWEYRVKGDVVKDTHVGNIDLDEKEELLVASRNKIYVVDKDGKLGWDFWIFEGISNILSADFNKNNYTEIIVTSVNSTYNYEITRGFIKEQNATQHYALAGKHYGVGSYQKAKELAEIARELYAELDDSAGVSKCESLLERIDKGVNKNKGIEAQSIYNRAVMKYTMNDYLPARELAERARQLYMEINDPAGIKLCSSLIEKINREGHLENVTIENITSTTTIMFASSTVTAGVTITPITITPIDESEQPFESKIYSFLENRENAVYMIGTGLVLLMIFLPIRYKYFKKKKELKARIGEGEPEGEEKEKAEEPERKEEEIEKGEQPEEAKEQPEPEPRPEEETKEEEQPEEKVEEPKPEEEAKEEPKPEEEQPEEKPETEEEPEEEELELPETPELGEELDEIEKEFQEKFGEE